MMPLDICVNMTPIKNTNREEMAEEEPPSTVRKNPVIYNTPGGHSRTM